MENEQLELVDSMIKDMTFIDRHFDLDEDTGFDEYCSRILSNLEKLKELLSEEK